MRILINTILVLTFSISLAWADDSVVPPVSTQLNSQARQMVAMGVHTEDAAKMQNCFQERQMVRARNIVKAAKVQGLPVGPVVDKALEGMAKKVAAANILQAMEQVRSRYATALDQARQISPEPSRQRSLSRTMAQAMTAGMPVEDVAAITARVRSRQQTMARDNHAELAQETFAAARDMSRLGATSKSVVDTLSLALEKQYSVSQMNRLRSQFMHQSRSTQAEVVASRFQGRVRAGEDVGQQGSGSKGRSGSGGKGQGNDGKGSDGDSGSGGNGPGGGSDGGGSDGGGSDGGGSDGGGSGGNGSGGGSGGNGSGGGGGRN